MNGKTFGYFKDVLENASSSNTLVICDTKSSFINNNNLKGGEPQQNLNLVLKEMKEEAKKQYIFLTCFLNSNRFLFIE